MERTVAWFLEHQELVAPLKSAILGVLPAQLQAGAGRLTPVRGWCRLRYHREAKEVKPPNTGLVLAPTDGRRCLTRLRRSGRFSPPAEVPSSPCERSRDARVQRAKTLETTLAGIPPGVVDTIILSTTAS